VGDDDSGPEDVRMMRILSVRWYTNDNFQVLT
jgi:hypothetical protein